MSFLDSDQGGMATLEETLAFMDSLQWEGDSSSFFSDSRSSSISVPQEHEISSSDDSCFSPVRSTNVGNVSLDDAKQQQPKKTQSKRKRCTLSSSTRLQQRKKAELLYLRRRAQELEELMEQLKSSKRSSRTLLLGADAESTNVSASTLMELAKVQYQARLQSEETNRRLKVILSSQMNLSESLKEILKNQGVFEPGMNFTPPRFRSDFVAVGNQSFTMKDLQQKASRLYLDSGCMFRSESPPLFSNSMRISLDDNNRKKTVEIVMTTPVSCSMYTVSNLIWKELHNTRQYPDKWYETAQGKQSNFMEKKYVIFLRKQAETRKLSGMQFGCRFDEPNRTVFTLADIMVLTTTSLQFNIHSWIVVTPSASDPLNSSVIHLRTQLSVHCMEGIFPCAEDVGEIQDLVLTDIGNRFRLHMQYVQNWLVEETERLRARIDTV